MQSSRPNHRLQSYREAGFHCSRVAGNPRAHSCSTGKVSPEKIRSRAPACAGGNMSSVQEPHLHLEVGHILFLDIVGYSKLLGEEQKALVQELNQIVKRTWIKPCPFLF